jgi:hypothetical protein
MTFSPKTIAAAATGTALLVGLAWWEVVKNQTVAPPVVAAPPPSYKTVAKWAVSYDDTALGRVEGRATCNWKQGTCNVVLRNPVTNDLKTIRTTFPFSLPQNPLDSLEMDFSDGSPFDAPVEPPPDPSRVIQANDGESAYIEIGNGETQFDIEAKVSKRALPTGGQVHVTLEPQGDGSLSGGWDYFANPLTERPGLNGPGEGRTGYFTTLPDDDLPKLLASRMTAAQRESGNKYNPGGFLGKQTGGEYWQPLPPRIYGVYMLDDQAAFSQGQAYYTLSHKEGYRRFVVVGRDLPPRSQDIDKKDEISYSAWIDPDNANDEQKQMFERAWAALTKDMTSEEAADYRKLDAVMITAEVGRYANPGPKSFDWGGAVVKWDLQYGDNVADVRFIRMINETDTERLEQLAMPDKVAIEVETANQIDSDSIPLQIGGKTVQGSPVEVVATRVPGKKTLYRSPPIVIAVSGDAPSGGTIILAQDNSVVFAGVNREKITFLGASLAEGVTKELDLKNGLSADLWLAGLKDAGVCNSTQVDPTDWVNFAKKSAEHFSSYGQSAEITYGDHAATLVLKRTFEKAIIGKITELTAATKDDDLVEAWYRSMHDVVTLIPKYPLATAQVTGPAGANVDFSQAYSQDFAEKNFHISTTSDGSDKYIAWRRGATRQAMDFFSQKMKDAFDTVQHIPQCDRHALLKLTDSGFKSLVDRITPLLMKRRQGSALTEPDFIARAYLKNLNTLTERLESIKAFAKEVNERIVMAVLMLVPFAAEAVWAYGGIAGGGGVNALAGIIGGFAIWGYESAHDIYQTYQEHQDVAFAFGATSVLGLKQYFDAESRKTEWWATGLKVFGTGVMNGALARLGSRSIKEGLAAWRGQRIAATMPQGAAKSIYSNLLGNKVPQPELAALRKLNADDLFDVAMFLTKEQERISNGSLYGQARQYANWVFKKLGSQAVGQKLTAAEGAAVLRELQLQSLHPPDDFKVPVPAPDPLRAAKTELSESAQAEIRAAADMEFIRLEYAQSYLTDTPVNTLLGKNRALPKLPKPFPDRPWLPKPGIKWTRDVTVNGAVKKVTFEFESYLAEGGFSQVYVLKSVPPELGIAPKAGRRYVLKVVKQVAEIDDFVRIPEAKTNVLARMVKGQNTLRAKNIGQAEFKDFVGKIEQSELEAYRNLKQIPADKPIEVSDNFSFLVQELLPFREQPDKFKMCPRMTTLDRENPAAWLAKLPEDEQKAIAKLFSDVGDARVAFLDCHGGNIYLEKVGNRWEAKILDQDFITEFEHVNEGVYGKFLQGIQNDMGKIAFSTMAPAAADPLYSTPRSLMQKLMEHQGWLKFGYEEKAWEHGRLNPAWVKDAMKDLMYPIAAPAH